MPIRWLRRLDRCLYFVVRSSLLGVSIYLVTPELAANLGCTLHYKLHYTLHYRDSQQDLLRGRYVRPESVMAAFRRVPSLSHTLSLPFICGPVGPNLQRAYLAKASAVSSTHSRTRVGTREQPSGSFEASSPRVPRHWISRLQTRYSTPHAAMRRSLLAYVVILCGVHPAPLPPPLLF